jgi:hypothetical protein
MYSWDDSQGRVAIVQLNAELRHAQLELLSAHCATDQLRLRFSIEDIARYAQRDVLRKALGTATALHDYYSAIEKHRVACDTASQAEAVKVDERRIREAVTRVSSYLRQQRDHYFPLANSLGSSYTTRMERFFSPPLLATVRTVELHGRRLPNPPFCEEVKAQGLANLPEFNHMSSVTFVDVVVFNERITERALFHGLVHAVQVQILGLERYTEIFVRGLMSRNSHFNVPLEVQANALESRFAAKDTASFSVEEQVRLWVNQGRYQ